MLNFLRPTFRLRIPTWRRKALPSWYLRTRSAVQAGLFVGVVGLFGFRPDSPWQIAALSLLAIGAGLLAGAPRASQLRIGAMDRLLSLLIYALWAGPGVPLLAMAVATDDQGAFLSAFAALILAGGVVAVYGTRVRGGRRWITVAVGLLSLSAGVLLAAYAGGQPVAVPLGLLAGIVGVRTRDGLIEPLLARRSVTRDRAADVERTAQLNGQARNVAHAVLPRRGPVSVVLVPAGPTVRGRPAGLLLLTHAGLIGIPADRHDPRKALSDVQKRTVEALGRVSAATGLPAALMCAGGRPHILHVATYATSSTRKVRRQPDETVTVAVLRGPLEASASALSGILRGTSRAERRWLAPRASRQTGLRAYVTSAAALRKALSSPPEPAAQAAVGAGSGPRQARREPSPRG